MTEPRTIKDLGHINLLAIDIHKTSTEHGFWPPNRNMGEMLMLMTSELAEALEEHRAGRPAVWYKHEQSCRMNLRSFPTPHMSGGEHPDCTCQMQPKPEGWAVEIVDAIIRELDTLHKAVCDGHIPTELGISGLMRLKMDYNETRAHKHGKRY